jgi:hypothetical protein
MHHEKVLTDLDEKPIHRSIGETLIFDRVKLCDVALRNKRLGCAHSGVNLNFEHVLDQLLIALPQCVKQISEFKSEFKSVILKIHTLDHNVGNLEHDIGMSKLSFDNFGKNNQEESLRFLKTEHDMLMKALKKIKTDIEQLTKTEINYSTI